MISANSYSNHDNEDEERAYDYVCTFMERSQEYREPYEDDWEKAYMEYSNTRSVKNNVLQRANLKLPYGFTVIETLTPQIVEAFFADAPYIDVKGRGWEDISFCEPLADHLSYQLDQTDIISKFSVFAKTNLIYGTAVSKLVWSTRKPSPTEDVSFDGIDIINIELQDFYPDWSCTNPGDIQSMRGCVHRVWRTLAQIKEKERTEDGFGIYHNIDKLEESLKSYGNNAWDIISMPPDDKMSQLKDNKNYTPGIKTGDKVELWEYWGIFSPNDDGVYEEYVITVANGSTVIRMDKNPLLGKYKPFVAAVNYAVPNEFYGQGEILPIYSLAKEGTSLRNARLDQVNQAVNRMWLVDRNSGINIRTLYSRPNALIHTNDMNGLRLLDAPEIPASSSREISQIDYDIQNTTAIMNASQPVSGVGKAFGKTATGVGFMQSTVSSRLSLKVRLIEELYIRKLGRMMMQMNCQFLNDSVWVRLNNTKNPYTTLPADAFSREYDFSAVGAIERLSKTQQQQTMMNVIVPLLQNVDKWNPLFIKPDVLLKKIFTKFDMKDCIEALVPEQDRQKMQAQQQQAQQQNMMMQHGMQLDAQSKLQAQETQGKVILENEKASNKAQIELLKGGMNVFTGAVQGRSSGDANG